MTGRERILAHLANQPVDRLPVMPITMMFAAAQIGARYQDYCTDYRVLVEGQLRTAEKFRLDHVNTMSDPAREAADCGARVEYFENQPVAIVESQALLENKARLPALRIPDPRGGGRMHNGIRALELYTQRTQGRFLIEGWVEGPIASAAALRGMNRLLVDFYDDPNFVRELFAFVLEMELRFARAQLEAGADLIGIGDAAASLVGPALYEQFVWPAEKKLVEGIHSMGGRTRLHICGNTRKILTGMGRLGCHIMDLDSLAPLAEARHQVGPVQVLLGNVDPVRIMRDGTPADVTREVRRCHEEAGDRFIIGAGCEIPRDTPEAHLRAMIACAQPV
jgi:MtaA/CmuA family methyltransferase